MIIDSIEQQPRKLEWLDEKTPCGIFLEAGAEGPRHWVIETEMCRVAIQLDPCPLRPAFSYIELEQSPFGVGFRPRPGMWMGKVDYDLMEPTTSTRFRGRTGVLRILRNRTRISCNSPSGGVKHFDEWMDWGGRHSREEYYARWSLVKPMADGSTLPLYRSPGHPPAAQPFHDPLEEIISINA